MPPPVLTTPNKRPKYAPGSGTPLQRNLMLAGAAACVIGVFLIPVAPDEDEVELQEKPKVADAPKSQPVVNPRNTAPNFSAQFNSIDSVPVAAPLPPVSEVTMFAATTPEEVDKRIDALSEYFLRAGQKDKDDALAALWHMKDSVLPKLPKLILECNTGALIYYAKLVEQFHAENCEDALIVRLSEKQQPVGLREMLQALASLKGAKAKQFIMAGLLKGSGSIPQREYWMSLQSHMDAERRDLALKTAADGKADSGAASEALALFGADEARARELVDLIRPLMDKSTNPGKLALVQALTGMHSDTVSNALTSYVMDLDPKLRAAAIKGIARNPQNVSMLIQTLRNDQHPDVQQACILGLLANPNEESLGELVKQMEKPELMHTIHRGLVRINKGVDLGKFPFQWQFWHRNGEYKDPADRPKIAVKEQPEAKQP